MQIRNMPVRVAIGHLITLAIPEALLRARRTKQLAVSATVDPNSLGERHVETGLAE